MRDLHIGRRLVSTEDAEHYINVFGWLIENFSNKLGLSNGRFYKLSEADFLNGVPPALEPKTSHWIEGQFSSLKNFCNMANWPMSFKARPVIMPQNDKTKMQKHRLFEIFSNSGDEEYYVDEFGRPVFYYEPSQIMQPGYIRLRIIRKLSDMLHKTALKPEFIQATPNIDLTVICGAFLGFGHVFCANQQPQKKFSCRRPKDNISAFSLCIFFQVLGLSLKDVQNIYGKYLSEVTSLNLRIGYKQLKSYDNEINDLRALIKGEPIARLAS